MSLEVIVLSYNHPELTARTLLSAQKFFQKITLIHNGSLEKHIQTLKKQFPNIQHVILEKNIGFTGGANTGLKFGFQNSDWILFITNDCILTHVGTIPQRPCLVGPLVYIQKTSKIDCLGGLFNPSKAQLKHCRSEHEYHNSTNYKYIPGSCFLMHKEIFQKTNGFDETLGTYWEDVDLSMRAHQKGYSLSIDPAWIFQHGIGKTCRKDSLYTIYYFNKNKIRICFKYCPQYLKPLLLFKIGLDFFKQTTKLIRSRRFTDFQKLLKAHF